jgi:hypothetical protein
MRLLTEYIFKPVLKLAFNIVKGIIMWILRQTGSFLRFAWPHALGITLRGFGLAFRLVILALVSAFQGPNTVNKIADEGVKRAKENGFPFMWERELRFLFQVLASFALVFGWGVILFTLWYGGNYALYLLFQP